MSLWGGVTPIFILSLTPLSNFHSSLVIPALKVYTDSAFRCGWGLGYYGANWKGFGFRECTTNIPTEIEKESGHRKLISLTGLEQIVGSGSEHRIVENKPDKKFMAMFLGFMDGDGYFDIGEQKQYNKTTKALVQSTIRVRLASNVHTRDLALLEYFLKVLRVGKISTMSGRDQVRIIFSKKDLEKVILPLIKEYNLQFLTYQREKQFALANFILENSIIH